MFIHWPFSQKKVVWPLLIDVRPSFDHSTPWITSGKELLLEICVSDLTLARAELLASMALYPINEFAAKETCRGAEIESDAV